MPKAKRGGMGIREIGRLPPGVKPDTYKAPPKMPEERRQCMAETADVTSPMAAMAINHAHRKKRAARSHACH